MGLSGRWTRQLLEASCGRRDFLHHVRQQHEGAAKGLPDHDHQTDWRTVQNDGRVQVTG